jgi:hypothetical protein
MNKLVINSIILPRFYKNRKRSSYTKNTYNSNRKVTKEVLNESIKYAEKLCKNDKDLVCMLSWDVVDELASLYDIQHINDKDLDKQYQSIIEYLDNNSKEEL